MDTWASSIVEKWHCRRSHSVACLKGDCRRLYNLGSFKYRSSHRVKNGLRLVIVCMVRLAWAMSSTSCCYSWSSKLQF